MALQVPWVKQKREKAADKDVRSVNTDKENDLLDLAKKRFELADAGKVAFDGEHLHNRWKRFDQIYRSQQWFESMPDDKSAPVLNFTFSLIRSLIPRLTSNRPKVLVKPKTSPDDTKLAEILQDVMSHLWYNNKMQEVKLAEVVMHMLKYGTGIIKTVWNPDMLDGLGDVDYSIIHPTNFFPDPRAITVEDMEYYFIKMPRSLEYFQRRWPEKGQFVRPDSDWMEDEALEGRARDSGEEAATLKEYCFRDKEGNICVMYYTGDLVLSVIGGEYDDDYDDEEGGFPVYRHNRFPVARVVDYQAEKEFWGIGEIEIVDILQQLVNAYEAQILDNTRLMANAQWVVNKTLSGLDETDAWVFDNAPGRVIFTHNDGVRKEAGVPIPVHIPQHLETLIEWMERILGIYDVVQGRRPVGVRAASAIIALQEAAGIRVQEKSNNMNAAIREIHEQGIGLVLEFYEEPRIVRLVGDTVPMTLNVREVLEDRMLTMADEAGLLPQEEETFAPEEEVMPEMGGMEQPMGMGQLPQGGAPQAEPSLDTLNNDQLQQVMDQIKFPEFDIEVEIGPSVPYSQALLYEESKEFYQLGVIDRRAVLEVTDFPNKEEILARMEQQEQAAMQSQMGERIGESTFRG